MGEAMSKPIKAKVARILNSREIVISAGTEQGVWVDMHFDVMDPNGEDIKDPDTGEVLGSVQRPKVRVKVTQAHEKLSVAMTYKKQEVNVGGSGTGFMADVGVLSRTLMPPKYITKYETLKTTEKTWEDLSEEESFVKTGDPVVQVIQAIPDEE
jgi:hypothetical protein